MSHTNVFTYCSPGKINHFLHITGKRQDGYHNLQTLFQYIDWCDTLTLTPTLDVEQRISLNINQVAHCPNDENNLIVKAAQILKPYQKTPQGAHIILDKQLPIGAGLGGGSSNAATTLMALNQIWKLKLPKQKLQEIAALLGADVPFFLEGHAALGEGIGEKLTPLVCQEHWLLLAIPNCFVSTQTMFQNKNLTTDTPSCTIGTDEAWQATSPGGSKWHNCFLPIALLEYPEIKVAYDWLAQFAQPKLSGSGAAIFACFLSENKAQYAASRAPAGLKVQVTRGLNKSPLFTSLAQRCNPENAV